MTFTRVRTSILTTLVVGLAACGGQTGAAGGTVAADTLGDVDPPNLALGDSIAFGFNPLLNLANINNFVGYPERISSWFDLADENASCPGETSGSFLSATAPDNGCRAKRALYPLHVSYPLPETQMQFALSYLATHNPKVITLDIGANDLLLLQAACTVGTTLDTNCVLSKLPGVLAAYGANLGQILGGIRAHGYLGQIVFMNLYAKDYRDLTQVTVIGLLNGVAKTVAAATGARVADAFAVFGFIAGQHGNDPCAAGLLIKLPDGTCDQHPSPFGRDILAGTVASQAILF